MKSPKKILILSPFFPYPAHSGGKVVLSGFLAALAKRFNVSLLSFREKGETIGAGVRWLKERDIDVKAVLRVNPSAKVREPISDALSSFITPAMTRALREKIDDFQPDILDIHFDLMAGYIQRIVPSRKFPVTLSLYDASMFDFDKSIHDRNCDEKTRFLRWNTIVRYLNGAVRKCDALAVFSRKEKDFFQKNYEGVRCEFFRVGYDAEAVRPVSPCAENNLLFVGNFLHYPNVDAATSFVSEIFPRVLEQVRDAKLLLAGAHVGVPAMASCRRKQVEFCSDFQETTDLYRRAGVFVSPVRLGGGVKVKILEAMAHGLPVVSFRAAAEAIDAKDGAEIQWADDHKDFVRKTVALLKDGGRRREMGKKARAYVLRNHRWDTVVGDYSRFYASMAKRRRTAG